MRQREWRMFIADMVEFCNAVITYTEDRDFESFLLDRTTYEATMWNLRLIGEAATNLPRSVRDANPQIEWQDIIGLRHHLTHAYLTIDNEIIWKTIKTDIPKLLNDLRNLLAGVDEQPS